jgi:hypothetical protein
MQSSAIARQMKLVRSIAQEGMAKQVGKFSVHRQIVAASRAARN